MGASVRHFVVIPWGFDQNQNLLDKAGGGNGYPGKKVAGAFCRQRPFGCFARKVPVTFSPSHTSLLSTMAWYLLEE